MLAHTYISSVFESIQGQRHQKTEFKMHLNLSTSQPSHPINRMSRENYDIDRRLAFKVGKTLALSTFRESFLAESN